MNREQIDFATKCMSEWASILEQNSLGGPTSADVDHSALLHYLLAGNRPFEKPPPKRYSYPCYALAEGKSVFVSDLWEDTMLSDYPSVVIDQSRAWDWKDKEQGILEHQNGDLYKFREGTAEEIADVCTSTLSRERLVADISKEINEKKARGILTGFLQRCDGPAPRRE